MIDINEQYFRLKIEAYNKRNPVKSWHPETTKYMYDTWYEWSKKKDAWVSEYFAQGTRKNSSRPTGKRFKYVIEIFSQWPSQQEEIKTEFINYCRFHNISPESVKF
jgi:hypothetical protein